MLCPVRCSRRTHGSNTAAQSPKEPNPLTSEPTDAPSIAFVVLWLGAFPRWFPATLRSFEANCNIDFYFFSDNLPTDLPPNIPPNCHFPFMNKTQFETLASRKFGKPIRLRAGYKLCDWRPALGHLFEELLRPYAFWGWCDIDTIWGQPRKYALVGDLVKDA